ncbi:MAG: hypothetical protein M1816_000069 [Peltula sp. TS41687]|nr:MAG: hypothetical protein M1816_000069 [Peltula sp. TS41687]
MGVELAGPLIARWSFTVADLNSSHFTSPTGRLYPKHLRQWSQFHDIHQAAFDGIAEVLHQPHVLPLPPGQHYQVSADEFMPCVLLRDEQDLVNYTQRTVEELVAALWHRTTATLLFKSRTDHSLDDLTNRVSQMTTDDDDHSSRPSTPKPKRRYDKLVFLDDGEGERPIFVVEYKAADKLTSDLLGSGLRDMNLQLIATRFPPKLNRGNLKTTRPSLPDPSTLYYHWVDIQAAAGPGLPFDHRLTAVGIVTAFARLAALHGPALGSRWRSWAWSILPDWRVDDDVILANVTPSPKAKSSARPSSPPYQGRTRPHLSILPRQTQELSDDEDDPMHHPKPSAPGPTGSKGAHQTASNPRRGKLNAKEKPQTRSFCISSMLAGHFIDRASLTQLLEHQLWEDTDDSGFESLDRSGWAGALFRVTLVSYGYTFVAKGTVRPLIPVLRKEAHIYRCLDWRRKLRHLDPALPLLLVAAVRRTNSELDTCFLRGPYFIVLERCRGLSTITQAGSYPQQKLPSVNGYIESQMLSLGLSG